MSGNLLLSYFDYNARKKHQDESKSIDVSQRTKDPFEKVHNILLFRNDFIRKFCSTETSSVEAGDFIRNANDFVTRLENTSLRGLTTFLDDFVTECAAPIEEALRMDCERPVADQINNQDIENKRKLLSSFTRDPAIDLMWTDIFSTMIWIYFSALLYSWAVDHKSEYDNSKISNSFNMMTFDFALALLFTEFALYNLYNLYSHNNTRGPSASNENFLKYLETASNACDDARPRLKM